MGYARCRVLVRQALVLRGARRWELPWEAGPLRGSRSAFGLVGGYRRWGELGVAVGGSWKSTATTPEVCEMSIPFEPGPVGYVYEQVAAHLEQRIRSGELPPNRPLPSEKGLSHEYGVSLGTSRHAVRLLSFRGLVKVIRSKGVYVMPLPGSGDGEQVTPETGCTCERQLP